MRIPVVSLAGLALVLVSCRLGDLPGAPTAVVAVPGDGRAEVRWTAPPIDPRTQKPITAYTVTAAPGGRTAKATGTSATVKGLTNGGTYTFTVAATNEAGTGLASAPSAPVVPVPAVAFDTAVVPVRSTASSFDPTWRWGPFMHVFVRAYRDSDGDGEGDLAGLIQKLDYLKDLGIRGIMLMPIFPSQDRDHGYKTTNWRDIDPQYGSLADFDRLLAEAHARGIGVVLDGVFMYSAPVHPGFAAASASPTSPWRGWYVWSDTAPERLPWWQEYWRQTPTGWYYARFEDNATFDWRNPAVRAYHENTLRFWLNRGVDGFRIDALSSYVQNGPGQLAFQPEDLEVGAELRKVVEQYPGRLMLCEGIEDPGLSTAWYDPNVYPDGRPPHYASSDVCGGGFLFSLLEVPRADGTIDRAQALVHAVRQQDDLVAGQALDRLERDPLGAPIGSMATMIANHDRYVGGRLWDQLGGDGPEYRLAAATLLLMPGTPTLYYGEEVGMAETPRPTANPGSDYHQRSVMSWTGDPANAGFSARARLDGPAAIADPADRYFAPAPNVADHNVAVEQADPGSLLGWYKQLIQLRKEHPALARGLYQPLPLGENLWSDRGAWVFERSGFDEDVLVVLNYAREERTLSFDAAYGMWDVLLTLGASPEPLGVYDGSTAEKGRAAVTLPPQSLVVYRLARQAPTVGELYVRGTFDGWEAPEAAHLRYLGANRYQGDVFLPAGPMQFKLANARWDTPVNAGIIGGGEVHLGEARILEQTGWRNGGSGAEVVLDVPAAGFYEFTLTADDPYRPVLTVQRAPAVAAWQRPPQPPAPSAVGLSWLPDPGGEVTWFFADGELLALFNNVGHTFIEFWVDGVNVIGGYDPTGGRTNWAPAVKGHSPGYPFGQFDAGIGAPWPWEGFYAGFNYIDPRVGNWVGGTGGPHTLEVQPTADGRLDVHVFNEVSQLGMPFYDIDVHYYLSRRGIGVHDHVTVLTELQPWGKGDSGGQFLMTQADSDIDPALPYDTAQQPDWYRQLVIDGTAVDLDPFPPYGKYTPSVEYTTDEAIQPPQYRMYALPGGGLVPPDGAMAYVTVMGRQSRPINLGLRVDRTRSALPQLEYYCEINGERDYLNFNFNAALGAPWTVPAGVTWDLYGDFLPWTGDDPEALRAVPMLSDGIP